MRSIRARDRHAAVKIADLRAAYPNAVVVVLFGESHLAPNHLPSLVRELRPREEVLTVLQNVDALYWMSAGEPEDLVEMVEVRDDVLCVFSATPLEKYEHYRLCIERWKQERTGRVDLAPCFYNLITSLWQFLNVNPYSVHSGSAPSFLIDELPEIWYANGAEQLERLLARRLSTRANEVRNAIKQQGSYFVADRNVIVAREFRMPWAAEQAARFVYRACRSSQGQTNGEPSEFYASVLECALGFLGSKILCPSRRLFSEGDIDEQYMRTPEELERAGWDPGRYMELLDFIVLHKDYERHRRRYRQAPAQLAVLGEFGPTYRQEGIRMLGHALGSELYTAYLRGQIGKRWLRRLFFKDISKAGVARSVYMRASDATKPEPSRTRARMVS
jgi:hypothetical protein